MKNESIFNDFLKYVSLNILRHAAFSCYTLADTFFVFANLGANGITALHLALPVFCLINGTELMIGMGGGTRYSILKSRGDDEKADRVFTAAVCIAACSALVFVLCGAFLSVEMLFQQSTVPIHPVNRQVHPFITITDNS